MQPTQAASEIRIPLATGVTATVMLWWGMCTLIAAIFSAAMVIPLNRLSSNNDPNRHFLLLVPVFFFLGSIFFHFLAWRARASDVLLDLQAGGLRIEGGPHHGERFSFEDLDLAGCRIETNHNAHIQAGSHSTYEQRLILRRRTGREQVIATAMDDGEHASFEALLATLQALGGGDRRDPPGGAEALPDEARVILCPACSAPIVPVDAATARCRFCGADAEMTDEVRERLSRGRAATAAERRAEERLRWLLSRPMAGRTNRWLLGALAGKYLLPIFLILAVRFWVFLLAMVWVLSRMVKRQLAARQVYQSLILDYTATPAGPGAPLRCRRCGGALPDGEAGRVLCRCAYCGAHNLVGVNVHQRQGRAERRAAELLGLLLYEHRQRLGSLAWIGLGLLVAVYGVARGLGWAG